MTTHYQLEALARRICESSADGNGDYDAKGTKKAYWRKRAQAVMDRQRGLSLADALMGIFGFTREQK